ncbi:hypothetical protein P7C71_g3214, partial [Lecanoromycetidae sp. Uapishka_2]
MQRPSTIFGPAAQANFAYVHEQGNRNGVAHEIPIRAEQGEEELQRLLGHKAIVSTHIRHGVKDDLPANLPPEFIACLDWHWLEGRLDNNLNTYYRTMNQGDSSTVPGQGGRPSLLRDVLLADAQTDRDTRSGWKRVGGVGK